MKSDELTAKNVASWDQEASEGGRHTRPWVDLEAAEVLPYVDGRIEVNNERATAYCR